MIQYNIKPNKKYVLWNMGICPIASKVRHVTLATPPLGSFIVPYVVLPMAYPTKKQELSCRKQIRVSCINTNYTMTLKSGLEVTQGH